MVASSWTLISMLRENCCGACLPLRAVSCSQVPCSVGTGSAVVIACDTDIKLGLTNRCIAVLCNLILLFETCVQLVGPGLQADVDHPLCELQPGGVAGRARDEDQPGGVPGKAAHPPSRRGVAGLEAGGPSGHRTVRVVNLGGGRGMDKLILVSETYRWYEVWTYAPGTQTLVSAWVQRAHTRPGSHIQATQASLGPLALFARAVSSNSDTNFSFWHEERKSL